ncbi:MAG: glycoside hydrolase family 2 protein, partial [Candidatus Limiplasma sp.]|nr:glycoside hydrolase family 2 protein [Candidatus Limiplasma sp.]
MKERYPLDGAWVLKEALGQENIPATVPGSVLGDLLAAGLIADPFYRENEYEALRLFDRDYTYETLFAVPESLLRRQQVDLVFEGLDTLAEVTLNGTPVLHADNMHRTWRVPVRHLLTAGE